RLGAAIMPGLAGQSPDYWGTKIVTGGGMPQYRMERSSLAKVRNVTGMAAYAHKKTGRSRVQKLLTDHH
ncbi:hypothetical protein Q3O97_12770, partial [Ralstonia pseudosolanacearum]|uniref:hypothetical protein n=1 Tax=Ralstonia pseudosolanacearum TaxID=1310165 RepID=UPI00270EE154